MIALLKIFNMYFTGTRLSNEGSIQSSNTTDELSNKFLDEVGIEFGNYIFVCYSTVLILLKGDSLEAMLNTFLVYQDVCILCIMYIDFLDHTF